MKLNLPGTTLVIKSFNFRSSEADKLIMSTVNFCKPWVSFCLGLIFSGVISAASEPASEPLQYWTPPKYQDQQAMGYSSNTFDVPPSLKSDVEFWIMIYTKFTTQQGVFHLAGDTQRIIGEIDLSDTFANPQWSPIRRELEAELLVRRAKKRLAKELNIKNANQIRLQMGLKDRMLKAIEISGLYLPMMEKVFKEQNLPIELTRMVFVESSFNINAGSKVGASGLWQIMPRLARQFKYIQSSYDQRNHPYYSTKLAAKILKENFNILKSWPLAVTGYNHGVGSLNRIVKKYKVRDIGYLAENVKAKKSFGFASRNFYATFLAALHVEANANLYFPEPITKQLELVQKDYKLKKNIKYEELLSLFDEDHDKLRLYNPHVRSKYFHIGKTVPAQTLICLPEKLQKRVAGIEEYK
ncbi:MAG: lytic transglycosylase domain-containing protein [Bdellovibrionaceae bacterium]|nr:lytic transglycosylase domain-containing protein [Bdellovibrio sp.]